MVFSSLNFLFLFFPALLVCYFALPARFRTGRNLVLLAFSLVFYACAGWRYFPVMLASIALNYGFGLLCAADREKIRRASAVLSVVCNLALLGWFKYAVFAAESLNALGLTVPVPQVVLPVGISFFTFQGMSYVLDVYRGEARAEKNPLWVALYIALFPQLVAGPIVRYTTVADEIRTRRESVDEFTEGLVRFLLGFAKKMLLANPLGQIADGAFDTPVAQLSAGMAWLGMLAYGLQIYFDFSGYSDMAIGLGKVFGFHFLENFDYPYLSRSVTEFWRRWHMSLGTWFRDYVYIPLGGNRCARWKQVRNILVVWTLTGFWHGAAWNFLFWGLYYGLLLLGEKVLWGRRLERLPSPLRHAYALLLVFFGWVFFRAESLGYAAGMFRVMFGFGSGGQAGQAVYYLLEFKWELLAGLVAALPVKGWAEQALQRRRGQGWADAAALWGPRVLALGLGFWSFVQLVSSTFNPFIYFRF